MQMYEIRRGAHLLCRFRGGPLEVVRVDNPKVKKVTVTRQNGEAWDVYPPSLHPNPDNLPFNLEVQEASDLVLGSAVTFTDGPKQGDIYVVFGLNSGGSGFKLCRLFGEGNQYYKGIPGTRIREASHEDVAEYLLARANRA